MERELEEQGYLNRSGDRLDLTAKAVRRLGQTALRHVFAAVPGLAPLEIEPGRILVADDEEGMRSYLATIRRDPDDFITVVVPEVVPGAVLFGWLLGGESFSLWSLMGGALVLIGVWLIFRQAKPAEREECETALPRG